MSALEDARASRSEEPLSDLNDYLGTLPTGRMVRLTDDQLTSYLRERYQTSSREKKRRLNASMRLDFYLDRAMPHLEDDLRAVFRDQRVLQWRKAMLPFAQFQNLTRRVVVERSAVYSEPATRTIRKANERYQQFQRVLGMDRRMREVNRLTNLLNDVVVYPWRMVDGTPRLDVITPDRFFAISHPNDPLWLVGLIIDQTPRGMGVTTQSPHYLVVDEETYFWLDGDWRMVASKPRVRHGHGRIPMLLVHRQTPSSDLLDCSSGTDIVSAHRAIALLNVLMLKAQKAGTQMPVVTGDTSGMAREQPMDEEGILEAPEGVAVTTLDLRADPNNYITAARSVLKQLAANYGIPESVFDLSYQATSGFEIELKRIGLREVRRDQILDYRDVERELVQLQSRVMSGSEYGFTADGWSISFGEVETPNEPLAQLQYWEKLSKMGLANVVEMYRTLNPEATEAQAINAIDRNLEMWLDKVRMYQRANASPHAPDSEMVSRPQRTEKDGDG